MGRKRRGPITAQVSHAQVLSPPLPAPSLTLPASSARARFRRSPRVAAIARRPTPDVASFPTSRCRPRRRYLLTQRRLTSAPPPRVPALADLPAATVSSPTGRRCLTLAPPPSSPDLRAAPTRPFPTSPLRPPPRCPPHPLGPAGGLRPAPSRA